MKNRKLGKSSSTLLIVAGVIGAIVVGFFVIEGYRLGELKSTLPEYVIHDTQDAAMAAGITLAKQTENGRFSHGVGLSNSWYLPFAESVIVTEPVKIGDLKKNDFVTYVNGSGVKVFHRLIVEKDDGWVAMGDNNTFADADLVTDRNLTGRLVEPIHTWKSALLSE